MTNQNDRSGDERREPIGSIRIRWRPLYSVLFVAQALPGLAFIIWAELASVTNDSPADTVKAILWGITLVVGASIATTVTLAEVHDLMLGTRDLINDWIRKKRERENAEIRERVREEMRSEFLAWVERRDAAREKGEPFDEPPPSSNKS